jgi:hypothetical protein
MTETNTVASLFELVIAAEKAARDLYLAFSERFVTPPAVSDFWKSLAYDEQDHADLLEEVYAALSLEQREVPVDPDIMQKARALERYLPEDVLARAMTLKEAYWLAHDLENSEINALFDFILNAFIDDEAKQRFALMQLQNHVSKLVEPSAVKEAVWKES